jgi:hypothetical protein
MKITSLTISPVRSYSALSSDNHLRAVVKLSDEKSSVETVIPEEMMLPLLDMVAGLVAKAAQKNVADFAAAVSAIEQVGTKSIEVDQ